MTPPCGNTFPPCDKRARSVTITNHPAHREFWQCEERVQVRALIGIPYGRMPQDVNVIGTRDSARQCAPPSRIQLTPAKVPSTSVETSQSRKIPPEAVSLSPASSCPPFHDGFFHAYLFDEWP